MAFNISVLISSSEARNLLFNCISSVFILNLEDILRKKVGSPRHLNSSVNNVSYHLSQDVKKGVGH